jgi:SSS family solute:Na+ symporter
MPGEAIGNGPVWLTTLIGYPLVYLIVGYVLLPVFMQQRVTSAYELLEARLGSGTRRMGAALFVLLRLVWMSTLVYFAATALAIVMGVSPKWEPLIVVVTGLIAVGYTSMGGLRAVVITDLAQTILLYCGALLVIGIISYRMQGFSWFPTVWHSNWDSQPLLSFDPAVRLSVLAVILSRVTWQVCTIASDQVAIQRFMATRDARAARRSLAANLIVATIVLTTLFLAGFALLGYYQTFPNALPASLSLQGSADKIFPHFIATGLPPVISGLVVSALLAAAMSSIDSGVNSITAVVSSDFLPRGGDSEADEIRRYRRAKALALVVGLIVIGFSWMVKYVPGNITAITSKTVNLLTVPIFCLFYFALFVKYARPAGVWLGTVAGIIVAVLIAFSGPILGYKAETGTDPVSFVWMSPATLVVNILVGHFACLLLPRDGSPTMRFLRWLPLALASLFAVGLLTVWRPSMHIRLSAEQRATCMSVLQSGLDSDEFWPSMHAAEALTQNGQAPLVREHLNALLSDELDDQQRCGVVRELVRAGTTENLQTLIDLLLAEDPYAHVHAAESLYKILPPESDASYLQTVFERTDNPRLRLMTAAALARLGDNASMQFIRESLDASDTDIRRTAAWILGLLGSSADIEIIRPGRDETLPEIERVFREHALAVLGDATGATALRQNLEHGDKKIRVYAAEAAASTQLVVLAPTLIKLLEDPDQDVRIRAAQALLHLARR